MRIEFNGIDATTGGYLTPPLTLRQLAAIARGESPDEALLDELRVRRDGVRPCGLKAGLDGKRLSQAGWGVVFAARDSGAAEARRGLEELLEMRRAQAGPLYQELQYRPGESKVDFLSRYQAGAGSVDPQVVPYYLLLVGGPGVIPFEVQYQLDVAYAVGRLDFETQAEYRAYAQTVIAAESGSIDLGTRATFFAPDRDKATKRSAEELVAPLADEFAAAHEWDVSTMVGAEARKSRLSSLLSGADTPALLFAASHGIGFPCGDSRQRKRQGALLCQDWPGPVHTPRPVDANHYFSGEDVDECSGPRGLIAFLFACYGGGTPAEDYFSDRFGGARRQAPCDFLGYLPRRLLGHPRGGALAIVAHVDRAWSWSFSWFRRAPQRTVFGDSLHNLVAGHPVGSAFEAFDQRYAELASDLVEAQRSKRTENDTLAGLWAATNDARSYVILGDPAVRLAPVCREWPQPRVADRPTAGLT